MKHYEKIQLEIDLGCILKRYKSILLRIFPMDPKVKGRPWSGLKLRLINTEQHSAQLTKQFMTVNGRIWLYHTLYCKAFSR